MPCINLPVTPTGPLIEVWIGVSHPRQTALQAAGQAVPQYVRGSFLIDTGATSTCVDPGVVAPLGLSPSGVVNIQTPSTAGTQHPCNLFDVSLLIPKNLSVNR
jgi:hypothetical protein